MIIIVLNNFKQPFICILIRFQFVGGLLPAFSSMILRPNVPFQFYTNKIGEVLDSNIFLFINFKKISPRYIYWTFYSLSTVKIVYLSGYFNQLS